jgi:tetratricopeptide (TPR) repeat protein
MRRARGSFIAAALCSIVLIAGVVGPADASAGSASASLTPGKAAEVFAEANARYEKGDYEEAIRLYNELVEGGVNEADLYYNLGNAYYKNGEIGRAVLSYERAKRFAPRDKDLKSNLELLNTLLRDKQFVRRRNRFLGALVWAYRDLSLDEILVLSSVLYLLLAVLLAAFIFRSRPAVQAVQRRMSMLSPGRLLGLSMRQDFIAAIVVVSLLFAAAAGMSAKKIAEERSRTQAVVVAKEAMVFSAPSEDSTLQFRIHEGTRVKLEEEPRNGWVRITLPGGLSGWIRSSAAERI